MYPSRRLALVQMLNGRSITLRYHVALDLHGGGQLIFFLSKVRLKDVELLDALRVGDGGIDLVDGILQLRAGWDRWPALA